MSKRIDPNRADFAARRAALERRNEFLVWPVAVEAIIRIGDTVTLDRDGHGRPHDGIDLFVPAGTPVVNAARGIVTAVVDGRFNSDPHLKRAGLFVEVTGHDSSLYRYLHLGNVLVEEGDAVDPRQLVGEVAAPFTSGVGKKSHLHFEIREPAKAGQRYGRPINPLLYLPKRRA